jgi:hypothetical protein
MTCNNLCLTGNKIDNTEQDRQCRYQRNTVLHNHCCHGKAIRISYSDCISIALVIHHPNRMLHTMFSYVTWLNFKCVWSLTHFSFHEESSEIWSQAYTSRPVFVSRFNETWIFPKDFWKINTKLHANRQVGAEFFHADGWIHGQTETDVTKLIVGVRSYCERAYNIHFVTVVLRVGLQGIASQVSA